MRRGVLVVAALGALLTAARAQEPDYRDDLRFAEALRNRGDNDLALEFLQRLERGAPPELLREMPLELAKTRLRVAADEPETARRLAMYAAARDEFQKFIRDNPGHPRLAEANIDVARVLNLQGNTQLNQALLTEDAKGRREAAAQSRATLEEAARRLQAAGKELAAAAARLPDPDGFKDLRRKREAEAARFRADAEVRQTELDRALNLYDQASGYILVANDEAASQRLVGARGLLAPLASGDPRQSITWKARAWLGRVLAETDTSDKAHAKFLEVLAAQAQPAAADGVRLARYFQLKVTSEKPRPEDAKKGVNALVLAGARSWRRDYPRYAHTPEGHGLAFLLAQTLVAEAGDASKKLSATTVADYRKQARALLRELETSENEFTDRARRLKVQLMSQQGLFSKKIAQIEGFEDCYVRAQYEAMQLAREKDEAKRKGHVTNVLAALDKALASPQVKRMRPGLELNTARSMYAYWALTTGRLADAIRVGEPFARDQPRSGQAEMAAVYALQAYGKLVAGKLAKFEDDAQEVRQRMFGLAGYMEERWPTTLAGDLARHMVGLQLKQEENYREAIKKLSLIGPGYGSYTLVCFQLADACGKAEKAGLEPIEGDRPGDYKKRAMLALAAMPEAALGPDPFTNYLTVSGKATLGRDLFRLKRFAQMDDLAAGYLARIDRLRFNDSEDRDRAARNQLRSELVDVKLLARYGLADAAFQAGNFKRVAELLDPLVDAAAGGDSQEKANLRKNQQLGTALLTLALRSHVQLGHVERTDAVLGVIEGVTEEEGAGATGILKLLAFLIRGQIDDLRRKGDKEALAKAIDGYGKILDKRTAKQKPTPEFTRAVADCYSSMGKHALAAAALEKVPDPKARPGTPEEKAYRALQLALSRESRLSKTPEGVARARKLMAEIMGDPKTGWGRRDLLALMEEGQVLEAEGKYAEAFALWGNLVKRLLPSVSRGGAIKDRYLECYFHMIESYYRLGLTKAAQGERDRHTATAAQQLAGLEKSYGEDFGGEANRQRVAELLAAEAPLRERFEALRKKK